MRYNRLILNLQPNISEHMTTLERLLEQFRQDSESDRALGEKFEQLVKDCFSMAPLYKDQYSDVWLWREWPDRPEKTDTGIDLVAKDQAGEYYAIQCKCYRPDRTLNKEEIDSFFTASGKEFETAEGKKSFGHRFIVSTTAHWSKHAEAALNHQSIPVTRLGVKDLEDSGIDWSQYPKKVQFHPKKTLRPHQKKAVEKVMHGFQQTDRGKLIMACGTGKTFTSLKIAEQLVTNKKSLVVFFVPSIALLSQTLREWTAEAKRKLYHIAVCSDAKASRTEAEDISVQELSFPATTDVAMLIKQVEAIHNHTAQNILTVIFSTYQSIEVLIQAQAQGLPEFDLVVCDEAHRTTGVTLAGDEASHFVKVHQHLQAYKRLYMTATPRIFEDSAKSKAQEHDAVLCSMDDEQVYGPELHRLGFSEAVSQGLLSDYQVMVLTVDERYINQAFQAQLTDQDNELTVDDLAKIVGCWNGLAKHHVENIDATTPMRRAVAFSGRIKDSEKIAHLFSKIVDQSIQQHPGKKLLQCEVHHVDGKMDILERNKWLEWLKAEPQANHCRILSNARCLSEGVDVPALDAVMFLTPRHSIVDVVQSVGRVMRRRGRNMVM